ncbi:MAG: hypothetical protein AAFQ67_05195 [Pseudomonadota bacterium]
MYDARDPKTVGNYSDILFGGMVLGVVALAFLVGWGGPKVVASFTGGGDKPALQASATPARELGSLGEVFSDKRGRAYLGKLKTLDASAFADLERTIAATPKDEAAQRLALFMHAQTLTQKNARTLAKADVKYFDQSLDVLNDSLKRAASRGARMCKGSFYEQFADGDFARAMGTVQSWLGSDALYDVAMDLNLITLNALEDGRTNPKSYGRLTNSDEQALQSVMFSLMGDKQFMSLMQAAQSGADEKAILRRVNICSMGSSLIDAFDKLPNETKGRLWAQTMRDSGKGLGQFGNSFGGFGGL